MLSDYTFNYSCTTIEQKRKANKDGYDKCSPFWKRNSKPRENEDKYAKSYSCPFSFDRKEDSSNDLLNSHDKQNYPKYQLLQHEMRRLEIVKRR